MVPMKFLKYCLIHGSFSLLIGYPNSAASTQLLCFVTSYWTPPDQKPQEKSDTLLQGLN